MREHIRYSSERRSDEFLRLNSCGEQTINQRDVTTLRENGRIDFSVQYIKSGKGYINGEKQSTVAEQGSIILYFPGVRQNYTFEKSDSARLMWMHFTGTACKMLEPLKSDGAVIVKIANAREFERIFGRMIIAKCLDEPYRDEICNGYLTVLLALIMKSTADTSETLSPSGKDGLDRVLNYMHENFKEQIDLEKYAGMCFVSRNRFIHMFKAYTGVSPYHYQLQIRIDLAVEMLSNTSVSVSDCADAVGFRDCSYFCRIFRKFTSHTPMYYKK